jgi:hypothetical protein
MKTRLSFLLLLPFCILACQPILQKKESIPLATSAENGVEVTISMQRNESDQLFLSATFTPQDPSLHLYSKDIPKTGVEGLGRPALLEIPNDSTIKVLGDLTESVHAQSSDSGPQELLVYPEGSITLSLPVKLLDPNVRTETVYVTYMACNQQGCRPPVEHKAIKINLPKY